MGTCENGQSYSFQEGCFVAAILAFSLYTMITFIIINLTCHGLFPSCYPAWWYFFALTVLGIDFKVCKLDGSQVNLHTTPATEFTSLNTSVPCAIKVSAVTEL